MVNSINTNIAAYFAQSNIGLAANSSSTSVARLSSGNRIIKASDDVAGLAIGTSLRTNVATLKVARLNSSLGTSLLQVADGALAQIGEILQRQKAIAVQASSGSLSPTQRGFLDQEFQQLVQEIDRIASGTNFNGVSLLNGSLSSAVQEITGQFLTNNGADEDAYVINGLAGTLNNPSGLTDGNATPAPVTHAIITAFAAVAPNPGTIALNPELIGNISNFTVTHVYSSADDDEAVFNMSFEINGHVFQANGVDFGAFDDEGTEDVDITFTQVVGGGDVPAQFTVTLADMNQVAIDGITDVDTLNDSFFGTVATTTLADLFNSLYVSQDRILSASPAVSSVGTALEGLGASSVVFNTFKLNTTAVDDPATSYTEANNYGTVTAASVDRIGSTAFANGHISVTIGGKLFEMFNLNAETNGTVLEATDELVLTHIDGETSRNETITITLTGIANLDIGTEEGAEALAEGLLSVLSGVAQEDAPSGAAISFQVGVISSDSLSVSLDSAQTTDLYAGASLNVLTADAAVLAADAVDIALDAITTIRASVGALQSRFNFATANIDSTIQNQDAARGELLDTDIASEATAYATSQVKLQAGISVLAQANQQLQSLLKLIG